MGKEDETTERMMRHLEVLVTNENGELDRRLKLAAFFILAAEELRSAIVEKVRFFLGADGLLPPSTRLDSEYKGLKSKRTAEQLSAATTWFRDLDAITDDDVAIIRFAIDTRNDAAHELGRMLYDSEESRLSELYVFSIIATTNKINQWWFENVEAATDPDLQEKLEATDYSKVETVGAMLTRHLFLAAFPDFAEEMRSMTDAGHLSEASDGAAKRKP